MHIERERKFLIKTLPKEIVLNTGIKILQGYLKNKKSGKEIRIRTENNKHYKTLKFGKGETRFEENIELKKLEFNKSWKELNDKQIIRKIRYKIPYKEYQIELDIYSGKLRGLIIAEVEFENQEQSKNFVSPAWFKKEVTFDERYKNGCLVKKGIPENI